MDPTADRACIVGVLQGGGGRDGSPFEGGDLDLKRQLSARSLSGQLEMARTHSGPLPIVTSGGREPCCPLLGSAAVVPVSTLLLLPLLASLRCCAPQRCLLILHAAYLHSCACTQLHSIRCAPCWIASAVVPHAQPRCCAACGSLLCHVAPACASSAAPDLGVLPIAGGSQGGANDIGLGLGSRPSISTGLPPQPRGASRLATPLKPKSRDASPTTPSPASSPGIPPQAAPGQHLHITTGGGGGDGAAARQQSGLAPADSGIQPSAFASAAAQQQQRASASPGAGRSGAAMAAQEAPQQPAAAEQQPAGALQPPPRQQPPAQQQPAQPQQQPLPQLLSPQQPASPSARPSSGAAGASPARREGSLRAWIPASAADAAAGAGLQAAAAGDAAAAAAAAAAMQQNTAAGVAVPQQQQQQPQQQQ